MPRSAGWLMLSFVLGATLLGGCPADPAATDNGGGFAGLGNRHPVAVLTANPSTGIRPGDVVTLDASGSSDPDNDALTFAWAQVEGPAATLSSASGPSITFTAPLIVENTPIRFRVTATDGKGGQASAEFSATVEVAAEFAGHPQGTGAYRNSLTRDEAYHLLRRTCFGAPPDLVNAAVANGLQATVDDLMTEKPYPVEMLALSMSYGNNIPQRWMVFLLESPNPFIERMALFWHDRFATSRRVLGGGSEANLAFKHWQMLRLNALGNYRDFLRNLTLDPLMLIWLDGGNSPKNNPNENYAREFWELFTLGRDVLYTEADIKEGARAFTGIYLLYENGMTPRPVFDITNHDTTLKHVFPDRANPANYDYLGVIDLTLAQPEAPRYVARNLFTILVHDHPSDAVVQELADFLVANNYELAPLVRRILTSQAMFSPDARGNQIASPVEHWVGVARTLDMHMYSEDSQGYTLDRVVDHLAESGQEPLNPPGVQGWDEDDGWLQDQWILSRVHALGRTMEYGPERTEDLPYHLLPPRETWNVRETRAQIVDAIADVFHLELNDEEHDIYVEVLDQGGYRAFHLLNPNDQPRHVQEMIRLMAMDERVIGR